MLFLPITLDCPPAQSFCNSTANFRVHTSVTYLINGHERPLLMGCFLKCLEISPFGWRWFCGRAINTLSQTFLWTRNIFTNDALIPQIYPACSFADAMFSLEKLFLLCVFCACAEHFQEQICIFVFHACAPRQKVASVSSGTKASATLWKIWKGRVFVLFCFFMNQRIWNFWEAIRISRPPYWFWWFSGTNSNTVQP